MSKTIDYFTTPVSPWTYLGHDRFVAIAAQARRVDPRAADRSLARCSRCRAGCRSRSARRSGRPTGWSSSQRWRDYLGLPLNLQPKFGVGARRPRVRNGCSRRRRPARTPRSRLAGALLRARWAEERDIADAATLAAIARACGLDAGPHRGRAPAAPEIAARVRRLTQEAIDRQVFGAPTYVYRDELVLGTGSARLPGPRTGTIADWHELA